MVSQNIKEFIKKNYKYYEGDNSFLKELAERTLFLFKKGYALLSGEIKKECGQ